MIFYLDPFLPQNCLHFLNHVYPVYRYLSLLMFILQFKVDGLNIYMARASSCIQFGLILQGVLALQFDSDADRRDLFMGTFVVSFM